MFLQYSYALEALLCGAVILLLASRGLVRQFRVLSVLLAVRFIHRIVLIAILFHRALFHIPRSTVLVVFFAQDWIFAVIDGALVLTLIYTTFWEAMRPLEGLHNIGKIVFRWVSGVSIAFSLALALGPHAPSINSYQMLVSRFDDGISVLTLCLLLFVCFAIRPLGLTYQSRIFGISLGLGITTSVDLIQSAWIASSGGAVVYSPVYLFQSVGSVVGISLWLTYFILPEPERIMILLPTTSPFFFWNRVSEVLGDEPGFVAVGGIKPGMLDPAELKVMSAAHKTHALGAEGTGQDPDGELSVLPSAAVR